jgi:protein gp37
MGKETDISYADSTINPCVGCMGCELHSKACPEKSTCYARALVERYRKAGNRGWPASFDAPEHFPGRIEKALKWPDLTGTRRPEKPWLNGYPRVVFVNDLSDGFHSIDPEIWLTPHLEAMAASPHIWLFCTKRPDVMRAYFESHAVPKNFWLMTTVTGQSTIWRAMNLRMIPARTRLISLEPLLGGVDLPPALGYNAPGDGEFCPVIHGVFVGGASGPKAQPCDVRWISAVVKDCLTARVPVMVKQLGSVAVVPASRQNHFDWGEGKFEPMDPLHPSTAMWRIKLLDRKGGDPAEWRDDLRVRQMPEVARG